MNSKQRESEVVKKPISKTFRFECSGVVLMDAAIGDSARLQLHRSNAEHKMLRITVEVIEPPYEQSSWWNRTDDFWKQEGDE